ncbi:MAG TPA: septum formation initiator family protein [Rhizomicrobium sp.]
MKSFFGAIVIPAISLAVAGYFGYYAFNGPRGYLAYHRADTQLAADDAQLNGVKDANARLKHRIDLLQDGHVDYDLVEELARDQMLAGSPSVIAVPRRPH